MLRSSIGDDKFVIEFIGSFPKFTVNKIVELYQVDIGINNNRYVTKHSNRDLLDLLERELNLNIFVLFEGKANEIYSAAG